MNEQETLAVETDDEVLTIDQALKNYQPLTANAAPSIDEFDELVLKENNVQKIEQLGFAEAKKLIEVKEKERQELAARLTKEIETKVIGYLEDFEKANDVRITLNPVLDLQGIANIMNLVIMNRQISTLALKTDKMNFMIEFNKDIEL